MLLISIPKPCHENWNEMSPREQGAFCKVCAKTVVDFTRLTDEEITSYFLQQTTQKTCGRFRNDQLADPRTLQELLARPFPFWKKFLAIVCIVFGSFLSSCHTANIDEIRVEDAVTTGKPERLQITKGLTLIDIRPDTALIEESVCTTLETQTIIADGMVEPPLLVGDTDVESTDSTHVKLDSALSIRTIKVDSIIQIDSVKKIIRQGSCDTLPGSVIEP